MRLFYQKNSTNALNKIISKTHIVVCLVVGVFRGARNRVRDCDQSGRLVVVARLEFSYARRGFFTLGYASAKSEYVYKVLLFEYLYDI